MANPNFVGAFLEGLLPLTVWMIARTSGAARVVWSGALRMQVQAIAVTVSRAAWLGMSTALACSLLLQPSRTRRPRAIAAVAIAVTAAFVALASTRSMAETLRGRVYIWSVTAPHLFDRPLTGGGPGSFGVRYPDWEIERWQRSVRSDARLFAAAQRHAHNDYIQMLAELGPMGLLAWRGVLAGAASTIDRQGTRGASAARPAPTMPGDSDLPTAALAGLLALSAVALVDFPLQRPAETFAWWSLIALVTMRPQGCERPAGGRPGAAGHASPPG